MCFILLFCLKTIYIKEIIEIKLIRIKEIKIIIKTRIILFFYPIPPHLKSLSFYTSRK